MEEEPNDTLMRAKLQDISNEIRISYLQDTDKTNEMKKAIQFINNILESDEPLEFHFNNNEELVKFFIGSFLKEVISNITIQNMVYGENGDEIAVDLLYHIYGLFLKFHTNTKYTQLFEVIREIIKPEESLPNFFKPIVDQRSVNKIDNIKRKYNGSNYNHKYCKEYVDTTKESKNEFNIGDKVDVLVPNETCRGGNSIDRKSWLRGEILSIDEDNMQYIVQCPSINKKFSIQKGGGEITKEGEKTKDWEWRLGIKEYDVIDCYDRSKWFPSMVTKVKNGHIYHVGFRLYPEHFKNPNDEQDTYENYLCFWKGHNLNKDSRGKEFFGDQETYDEDIAFHSKRIQKFQSYTNIQKNFLDVSIQYYARGYAIKSDIKNEMQKLNYELENDELEINPPDDTMFYEVNGKKNYIIGKTSKFNYYYALFWKHLADDDIFEYFIGILNNKPNAEEIYMILYTIYCAMPYLHKQYLKDNLDNFKKAIINFIDNLETKDIRNLPKNLTEIFNKFLKNIDEILLSDNINEKEKNMNKTIEEISIRLSIKMLKTSIFDKRIQGIKSLNEFIQENESNEESMHSLIDIIKKNEIIKEIFGANYHSQIISKSDKILSLLLKYNEVNEEDIKLIWDCAQRGDLEAKNIIMKLLSDLAHNLNENFINILLENVINKINSDKMNEQDIDFIYNLSIHGNNENNKMKCCEYLYQCILKFDFNFDNDFEIRNNQIMNKLITFAYGDEKFIQKILSMCENDLKKNNKSLSIMQILSIIIDRFTYFRDTINYLKDSVRDFMKDDNLLNLYKDNFIEYIKRIKEQIKSKPDTINIDEEKIDNYPHRTNIQKRFDFLNNWITLIYPEFDFVNFLKEILLTNPVSKNDETIFYDFIQKYISETSVNEIPIRKEKKEKMKEQIFKNFIENDQSNMTFSEFKLFISIFLGINSSNMCYLVDKDDNYDIRLSCQSIDDIKELDKLWNVIFQLKDEKVLNKAISIIFIIYKGANEIEKLLHKCKELINEDNKDTNINEVINKCFKLLRMIILESEKNVITKTKSHFNLIKNCYIYLPFKVSQKYANYYYNNYNNITENGQNNIQVEIIYGNTTINELKELIIDKERLPLKLIEIYLSKEYLNSIQSEKKEENELFLDDTYNNKSIMEILNQNYNQTLTLDKIFLFYSKNLEKESLLINNEFNPKFEKICKEWYKEFTNGEDQMDDKGVARYISKVTGTHEITNLQDIRIKQFFDEYDKEKTGFISEENFLKFYLDALRTNKEDTVWDNLKAMGIREDLYNKNDKYPIPYSDNSILPRYSLGNDKNFVANLFSFYNKCNIKKEIFEFLFFLTTNKEIYDDILINLNKENENIFQKIFGEKNNILKSLYCLIIIESILQDINIACTDFKILKNKFPTKDNGGEPVIELSPLKYEYFDEIDIETKKIFLKNFIINKNFEKLLKYMNELLLDYKFEKNEEENSDNLIINLCCEKCLNIVNIIYNSLNDKISENESVNIYKCTNGILPFDYNNLFTFINNDENIKQTIEQINFVEYTTNLIKFIDTLNKSLNKEDNNEQNNLLQNSFSLLINLLSNNDKLFSELYSNPEAKTNLEKLLNDTINTNNEYYKLFYINCFINSIKTSKKNSSNKFFNLLFELTNNIIFNQIMKEDHIDKVSHKSSILFFDFFSVLTSKLEDNIGNDFLFKIYEFLFKKLEHIEEEQNISKEIFVGLMNILLKRTKINESMKNIIINKEINGKTLLDLIMDKFYQKNDNEKEKEKDKDKDKENEEKKDNAINEEEIKKEEDLYIDLDTIKSLNANKTQKKEIPKEIKEVCSQYLIDNFKLSFDEKIINKLIKVIKVLSSDKSYEVEDAIKKHESTPSFKKHNHVGLKNLGCICYMNSILQQVYMVPTFRYAIMGYNDTDISNQIEDKSLSELQEMYTFLTLSEKEDYNPRSFCQEFKDFDGNPINVMIQQDSQEFFNNFFDKMENCLKNTNYKYIINDVFVGRTCSSVICESCKHVSNRFEDFYNLTLEVKNINNLNDSLHKLITPEKIEDFKCSNCNKNVTINKRTTLSDLPNVLVFHLKRFYMNYEIERTEKINSRFEFPLSINMKEFCIEDIDISGQKFDNDDIYLKDDSYYIYELKGINIHMGSADGGHYFSLINVLREGEGNILTEKNDMDVDEEEKKNHWLKFNDSHISVFDINDIEKECFGGSTKGQMYSYENFQNAYMLIYERKKKTPLRFRYNENDLKNLNDSGKEQENIIKLDNENKAKIKKMYNLAKKDANIDEKILYQKIFVDDEKKEYYKYIPFYNVEKRIPKKIYNQVMEKNDHLLKLKNKENDFQNHKKEYYDLLLNNINTKEFNILNYSKEIKNSIINLLVPGLFPPDNYLTDSEKLVHNRKSKIILEKIILPIVNISLESKEEENINRRYILMFDVLIVKKEYIKRVFINDYSAIFDKSNIENFYIMIKGLLELYKKQESNLYLSIIEILLNIIQEIDAVETYPKHANNSNDETPIYYVYKILYETSLKDKKVVKKLINQNCLSELLGKLTTENTRNKNVIYDMVLFLIKNLDEYDDKLFDVKEKEKTKTYFHEKHYLIKNISSIFIQILFEEKLELLIILLKLLQYDEPRFSKIFNTQYLYELFDYSTNEDKIEDMNKVLLGLLEINDKYTIDRLNYILGYPTLIIKDVQYQHNEDNKKEKEEEKNDLYDKEKEDNILIKDKKEKKIKYQWPLFGERLIKEKGDVDYKLKRHIFKYISFYHEHDDFCLLSRLMPELDENGEIVNEANKTITDKQRKDLIYDLFKLMLLGKGNYCIFKYIYLSPARCILYNNLYEEMFDILEQENKSSNNIIYDLTLIKQNAEMCIKRIDYEVETFLNFIRDSEIKGEEIEYKLPETMQKYFIQVDDVDKFIGSNPNFIPGNIIKEKIIILTHEGGIFLIRLEYFTEYKTKEEIRNELLSEKDDNKKDNHDEEKKEKEKENEDGQNKEEDKEENKEEEKQNQNEEKNNNEPTNNQENNNENTDSDNDEDIVIDITDVNHEFDKNDFLKEISRKYLYTQNNLIIKDKSYTNKTSKAISSLIRFNMLNYTSQQNSMNIQITQKDIPDDVKPNYYHCLQFWDFLKADDTSNFLNINRIRTDLPFLKKNQIGININIKNPKNMNHNN